MPSGNDSGTPAAGERDDADAVRPELGGELAAHRLDRVERDLRPSEEVVAHRGAAVAGAAEGQDHPERRGIMWRAAALAVKKVVLAAVCTGARKSSTAISARAVPWV